MPTVRMFCDWGHDSSHLINLLMSQTVTTSTSPNTFGEVTFTAGDDYDYAVVFNFAVDEVNVPAERIIGLVLEPSEILDAMYFNWKAFPVDVARDYYSFTPLPGFQLASGVGFATAPVDYDYPPDRPRKVCMVVSDKTYTAYQRKRREVLQALLKLDIDIDFYGRGMSVSGDHRIKGEIAPMQKHVVFSSYEMVIDFENDPWAVTDKFFDPVISGCTPITNSVVIEGGGLHRINFKYPVESIVGEIKRAIEAGPLDTSHLYTEVTSGSMSLANWINEKVKEIGNSSSGF